MSTLREKNAINRGLEVYPYNPAYTSNDIEYDGNFCNRLPYTEGYEQGWLDAVYELCDYIEENIDKHLFINKDFNEPQFNPDFIKEIKKKFK